MPHPKTCNKTKSTSNSSPVPGVPEEHQNTNDSRLRNKVRENKKQNLTEQRIACEFVTITKNKRKNLVEIRKEKKGGENER